MTTLTEDLPIVKQGADFLATLPINSDSVDINHCTFKGQIRRYSGGPLLSPLAISYSGGLLNISMTHDQTSLIPATLANKWVYDIFIILPDQSRLCLLEGKVTVDPAITEF